MTSYNYYHYSYIYLYLSLSIYTVSKQKDRKQLKDRRYVGEGLELSWSGYDQVTVYTYMKFLKSKKNQKKKENLEISYGK